MQVVQPQLQASNALKRLLPTKKDRLSLDEVSIVCAWNKKSVLSKTVSEANKLFKTTLDLLDRPTEGGILDQIPLLLMKAEWLAKWANYEIENVANSGIEVQGPRWIREKNNQALETYQLAVNQADTDCGSVDSRGHVWVPVSVSMRRDAYGKLAQHCEQQLRLMESAIEEKDNLNRTNNISNNSNNNNSNDNNSNNNNIIESDCELMTLAEQTVSAFTAGLELENAYCRDRLLRLTSLVGKFPHTEHSFLTRLQNIPAWIFLKFAPQLMGSLDQPERTVVLAVLTKVARTYPRAIYYPYNITKEFLGPKGKSLCERDRGLSFLLNDPTQDCFVQSLGGLTHPELRWNDGLKSIKKIVEKDLSKALEIYRGMYDDVLTTNWSKVRSIKL